MPRRPRLRRAGDDREFGRLAFEQDGVLARDQLAALGWSHDHVATAVAAQRWATYDNAVVLHRGPLSSRQCRWIAVLNARPTAALAGLTALEELGLVGFPSDAIHLIVAAGSWHGPQVPGVRVHVSRRFSPDDRHPARRLPVVRYPRAAIDAAAWSARPRRAAALLIASVQQRLVTPTGLRDELVLAGMVRHRSLLFRVLDDVEGGVSALSELDFVRLARRFKLPKPELQQKRTDSAGRTRYLDVRFRRPDGRAVNVEIDGSAHFGVVETWADMSRDFALMIAGEPLVRIPSAIVRSDPADVAARLREALEPRLVGRMSA